MGVTEYNASMKKQIHGVDDMYAHAATILAQLEPQAQAVIVTLSGDLGSGKTTFAQGVARALGVSEHVTSPTFVLEKIYDLNDQPFERLVHIDAYRLEGPNELAQLGFDALAEDPKNIILIEWPERVAEAIPSHAQIVRCEFVNENTREVAFEAHN
jgi:tRNA threonylcarbamoyl adenosine modification protein YjeE